MKLHCDETLSRATCPRKAVSFKRQLLLLAVMWLAFLPPTTHAQIVLVADATRPYNAAFVERLRALLPDITLQSLESYQAQRLLPKHASPRPKLTIALGAPALREALAGQLALPATPILSLLTAREQYEAIVSTVAKSESSAAAPVTALFGEPDPAVQLRLIQATFRRPVTVGVWATEENVANITRLRALAATLDITLVIERLALDGEQVMVSEVARATSARVDVDAWLAWPNAAIFTASNLKTILLVTYARSQPVFGFTATMVSAGAAASAWVPAPMLASEVAEIYRAVAGGVDLARFSGARYPNHFDVIVNESVLRSLSLPVAQTLKQLRRVP